jgi:hypothetical protein
MSSWNLRSLVMPNSRSTSLTLVVSQFLVASSRTSSDKPGGMAAPHKGYHVLFVGITLIVGAIQAMY